MSEERGTDVEVRRPVSALQERGSEEERVVVVSVSLGLEAELALLEPEERQEFLAELGYERGRIGPGHSSGL